MSTCFRFVILQLLLIILGNYWLFVDRVLAAGWVKKIKDNEAGTVKLRTDYMKLLLFALQRQKLVGIFADDPSKYQQLEEFPMEYDVRSFGILFLLFFKDKYIETLHKFS